MIANQRRGRRPFLRPAQPLAVHVVAAGRGHHRGASADEILSMLQLLNSDLGKTIVMVTHDPAAAKYARRTLHLDKGFFIEKDLAA